MRLSDRALAQAAQHASEERLHLFFGADGVEVRRGDGWFAVRTGVDSNDMNGVVSTPGAKVSAVLVADLLAWLAGAPASWLTSRGDPELTDLLLAAGARPERSGCWSGRWVEPVPAHRNGVEVCRVRTTRDLDRWIDLAAECGWIETASGRGARRRLYLALGLDNSRLSHWLAVDDGEAVGFASDFLDGDVVDLCNLGVLVAHRRRGIGSALVAGRLADAASVGAALAVSAPSTDGWRLQQSLGFQSVPVIPDTWFHLPSE